MKYRFIIFTSILFSSIACGMLQEMPVNEKKESQPKSNLKDLAGKKKQTLHDSGDETPSCCAALLNGLFGHLEKARPLGFNLPPYYCRDIN